MKNILTHLAFKSLLGAVVVGLFAGCAATRPISDAALGAGGASRKEFQPDTRLVLCNCRRKP